MKSQRLSFYLYIISMPLQKLVTFSYVIAMLSSNLMVFPCYLIVTSYSDFPDRLKHVFNLSYSWNLYFYSNHFFKDSVLAVRSLDEMALHKSISTIREIIINFNAWAFNFTYQKWYTLLESQTVHFRWEALKPNYLYLNPDSITY